MSSTTPPAVWSSSTIRCRTAPAEAGRYAPGRVRPTVAARSWRNAVPSCRFVELIRLALAAGKHVYCEWPLALNTAEAESLAEFASDAGIRHVGGLQTR
ncbi:Gfo/Idh/MocA family oxidoreductase [Nocardia sp. NPDC052278]|uniref:Gfo/Idh/MocA family oxidoreductase n=1 Tax=unclassified Nocardia TaxID=2637762 RepID=UPI00367C2963